LVGYLFEIPAAFSNAIASFQRSIAAKIGSGSANIGEVIIPSSYLNGAGGRIRNEAISHI
jgi:hypothetical protein